MIPTRCRLILTPGSLSFTPQRTDRSLLLRTVTSVPHSASFKPCPEGLHVKPRASPRGDNVLLSLRNKEQAHYTRSPQASLGCILCPLPPPQHPAPPAGEGSQDPPWNLKLLLFSPTTLHPWFAPYPWKPGGDFAHRIS